MIPIVLRSLAGLFGLVTETTLPFDMTPSFLATLDAGKHRNVKCYNLQWWTNRKPRNLKKAEILGTPNVMKCIRHYQQEKLKTSSMPAGAGAGAAEDSDSSIVLQTLHESKCGKSRDPGEDTGRAGPSTLNAGSSRPGPSIFSLNAGETSSSQCPRCEKYRQLLSDLLQDILKFQKFSSVMSTSSENLLNIGIRKASTFYHLNEAAILKESAAEDSDLDPKGPTAPRITEVVRNAESEFNRLKNLPESSYKWTWGETLTEKDILNLRSLSYPPRKILLHSGYDADMITGVQDGEYSEWPSTIGVSGQRDDVGPEVSFIPPSADLPLPEYFTNHEDRLIYNPFKLPDSSLRPTAPLHTSSGSNQNPASGTNPIDIIDLWTSGSESRSNGSQRPASLPLDIIGLASMWEDDDALPLATADANDIFELADAWESADTQNPAPGPTTTDDIIHLADMWDDTAAPHPSPMDSCSEGGSHHPDSILSLADLWIGEVQEEHSGDELANTSYPDQVPGNDEHQRDQNWAYGPANFDFLCDEMFESDG